MGEEFYEALIVGGGPAGLAAGICLGQAGIRTLILEKQTYPIDKACGEGLMPRGLWDLDELGARRHLSPNDAHPFQGISYICSRGRRVSASFAEGPGLGIPRLRLSAALYKRAQEIDALEIRVGERFLGLSQNEFITRVRTNTGVIQARLLIGADGLHSRIRRALGLAGEPGAGENPVTKSTAPRRWGARRHFDIAPWSDFVEVYWGDHIEAYITPGGPRTLGVAFLWNPDKFPAAGGPALFDSLLQAFPELQERLKGAPSSENQTRALGPLRQKSRGPVTRGALLIGDASGYLDAITGEGLSLAFSQALALKTTVIPVLKQKRLETAPRKQAITKKDLGAYRRRHKKITGPYYRLTGLVLLLSRFPTLREKIIYALEKQPGIFRHMLSANMGLKPMLPPTPLRLIRFLLALITHRPN